MSETKNRVLKLHKKFLGWPFGQLLFSKFAASHAPYFKTVSPIVNLLEPNRCQILIKKRKRVQNHIGTMHVIAVANGIEFAMGLMAEASIPPHLRWIPKGMQLNYPSKAETDILCTASVAADAWKPGDLSVEVEAVDTAGTTVMSGTVMLWISEKPPKEPAN